ncbi:MAG TPA: YicC/YloC family endoribonuclease, partial [Kofleriaceae bacterium]|nr:YicC/YloC family endoribonuclease [Kofleriaceae bacterium]
AGMRSMTGFGRGTQEHGRTRATVDIRAVNHRYLDLKLRGPLSPALEDAVGSRVRAAIDRGSVTVTVHLASASASSMRIDEAAAKGAHATLSGLAKTLGIEGPTLALVLSQPGVVISADETESSEAEAPVLAAVDAAVAQLVSMREAEGKALAKELTARIDELDRLRQQIATFAHDIPDRTRKKLQERLRRLLADEVTDKSSDAAGWLDPTRLAQEVALIAERADITEELVRLESHLGQARALITGKAAAGRRLEFLVQELGRELNTIGSKSAVTEISTAIVEGKAVLEKVREQVQNVE